MAKRALIVVLFIALRSSFVVAGDTAQGHIPSIEQYRSPVPILLDAHPPKEIILHQHSLYLIDSTPPHLETLSSVAEIRRRFSVQGNPSDGHINFGVSPYTFWFLFALTNQDSVPLSRLFVVEDFFLEEIDTYIFSGDSLRHHLRGGCVVPFQSREILHRFTAHRIHLLPHEHVEIMLRVRCSLTMSVPMKLWSEDAFVYDDSLKQIPIWMYYGLVLGLFAYNLFICWTLKNKTYALYLVYILHIAGFLFWGSNALGFQFVPLAVETSYRLIMYLGIMSMGLVSMLTMVFLDLRNALPRWYRLIQWYAGAMILLAFSAFVLPIQFVQTIGNPATGLLALLCGIVAVRSLWLNYLPARYFAAGWVLFLIATILFVLQDEGIIEWEFVSQYSAQLGSAAEMVLFSIALASRISVLQQERQEAREELLRTSQFLVESLQESEKNLESKVQERTITLQKANEQLSSQARQIEQSNEQLREKNIRLAQLDLEKNELLGVVSHDLKNPIGIIRIFAELLQQNIVDAERGREILQQIIDTANRMLALVGNLLEINRLEADGIPLRITSFAPEPLIKFVLDAYRPAATLKNITLHFEQQVQQQDSVHGKFDSHSNANTDTVVIADEQALMQIMDNLVSNAVKYSPHGKNVVVRLKSRADVLCIEVQDEGEGISEEDMKKLFGKFARLSAQPTGGEHSTGLGLSIVKKMVEAMNGRVWCESELGKGATFIVELPKALIS